jgi:hypothetical protein
MGQGGATEIRREARVTWDDLHVMYCGERDITGIIARRGKQFTVRRVEIREVGPWRPVMQSRYGVCARPPSRGQSV